MKKYLLFLLLTISCYCFSQRDEQFISACKRQIVENAREMQMLRETQPTTFEEVSKMYLAAYQAYFWGKSSFFYLKFYNQKPFSDKQITGFLETNKDSLDSELKKILDLLKQKYPEIEKDAETQNQLCRDVLLFCGSPKIQLNFLQETEKKKLPFEERVLTARTPYAAFLFSEQFAMPFLKDCKTEETETFRKEMTEYKQFITKIYQKLTTK